MTSPFDFAWTMLKEDVNYLHDAVESIQRIFGVNDDEAMRMVEQMHRHQLGEAGIPQDKIDREFANEGGGEGGPMGASDYLMQQFAKPMSFELSEMREGMDNSTRYQRYKDENSRKIGERTSKEAMAITNRPRSSPRVPQMSEEASYANISVPRESPIHGLEPFGEDKPMGASLPMPMADDVLEPIRQRHRDEEESVQASLFNPFTAQPPSTPPPMREEQGSPMGGTEGMSRGSMRSRKRGDPAREPRFVRPGFRGPPMPMSDKTAESRMQ